MKPRTPAAPNACRHCAAPPDEHGDAWSDETGWHQWVAPNDAQRLDRMLARREQRLGLTREPGACRWCGIENRPHGQRWNRAVGWHVWTAPGDVQRKERMRARRDERLASKLRRLGEIPAARIAAREAVMTPDPANPLHINTIA